MSARLIVRRAAAADISAIQRWYEREWHGGGEEFVSELDRVLARIGEMPLQFPEIRRGARRALLHRFPYTVFFILRGDDAIVFAVLHQRRRPSRWETRLHDSPSL